MAVKFLHTADWQIGAKHAILGPKAEKAREARFVAAERAIAAANDANVDAVLLAGDTFEDPNVRGEDVLRVVDILRKSAAPVFVLSGNHDPLVPKGPFDKAAWRDAAPKVSVFRDATPVACGAFDLFPRPVYRRTSHDDPLEGLPDAPVGARERIRIGVAHGTLLGAGARDADALDDFPMDRAHAARAGLDYLALGHWHVPSSHAIDGVDRIFYSGTHEPTAVDEVSADGARRSGQVLIVTIDAPGAPPKVETIRTAVFDWAEEAVALTSAADLEEFRKRLDSAPAAWRENAVRVFKLSGVVPPNAAVVLNDVEALAAARCFHARTDLRAVRFMPEGDAWVDKLPIGAPADAARALLKEAAGDDENAEIARRALRLLFELSETPS